MQRSLSGGRARIGRRDAVGRDRWTHQCPHLRERLLDLPHGGAAHLDPCIAPRRNVARGVAHPRLSDAETTDKPDRAVHGEHLSMIPAEPTQRARRSRRVVAANLDPPGAQSPPEHARGLAESAHPVVDDPHGDTVARPGDQRVAELGADGVVVNDIALEVDEPGRPRDRVEPRRVVLARVLQEANAVPRHQRRAGGPRERLFGERAHGRDDRVMRRAHGVR